MNKPKKVLSVLLICIAVLCLLLAGFITIKHFSEDRQNESGLDKYRVDSETLSPAPSPKDTGSPNDSSGNEDSSDTGLPSENDGQTDAEATPSPAPTPSPEPTPEPVSHPYADAFLDNEDTAGWLQIPGTNIDYPIMWTPRDENYYLYRAFDGSENVNGCLILDTDSCINPLSTNLIIHGHNMKSGAMFGNLTDYEDESYFEEHRRIILYTEECQRNYEVVAVFRSQVYKKTDNVFKFYKFFQADTQEEFDDFYKNIKKLSMYDTGVTAEFGDHFITLSTCVYHVTNGRFVVVAKEVEPGDTYLPIVH